MTFLLGNNPNNIKINYNKKENGSFNKTLLANGNGHFLNRNTKKALKNSSNKFGKKKSNTPFNNTNYISEENDNYPNRLFINDELRREQKIFFLAEKDISNINKK